MLCLLSIGLNLLAAVFRLFPVRRRVAMLSRQSAAVSQDYRLLEKELQEREPDLPIVVRTTNSEKNGVVQLAVHLIGQLWYASTSKVVILDGYNPVVCVPPKRSGVYVIQLWHAVGAVKKFGFQCLDTPAGRTTEYARLAHMHENYDVIVAGGHGSVASYSEAFGYPREKVLPMGLPHMDQLTHGPDRRTMLDGLAASYPFLKNGNANVLYAPTLRQDAVSSEWLTNAILELAGAFDGKPANLIVSIHPLAHLDETVSWPSNVFFIKGRSTGSLLRISDVLITDYSAVGLESGLIDVPALFYCPDIDEYRESPGLNIDPLEDDRLVGFSTARPLADVILDPDALRSASSLYRDFTTSQFAGYGGDATVRLAELVRERCL